MADGGEAGTRYTVISEHDQSGVLWIVSLISVCFTTVAIAARILSKLRFSFKFEVDDYVMVVAYAFGIIQSSLWFKALVLGFGKDSTLVDPSKVPGIATYFSAGTIFLLLSLYCTKVSLALLVQRLFQTRLTWLWISFSVIGVVVTITVEAGCFPGACRAPFTRWMIAMVFDVLTEIAVIALPIWCLRMVQMERQSKYKVILSFSSRIVVIVFAVLAMWRLAHFLFRQDRDPSTRAINPAIFHQFELMCSVCIASIVPCFRLLFQSSERTGPELIRRGGGSGGINMTYAKRPAVEDSFGLDSDSIHGDESAAPSGKVEHGFGLDSVHGDKSAAPSGKAAHSPSPSQDLAVVSSQTGEGSNGRASGSSITPSLRTGISQKPLAGK
ncbi:hypothetical protein EJ06DRAFT_288811 [Trichodelitschia bisporula]|uniref:Rhodopsin domain-containing protein n=1 Tax=Trichodelitschia bisporula TaxID=703511 RepID=A0A6G1I5W9_9PEZI|nr:hypothetical protein EJ06DRAFT_288811 [Trichodelitschia bisporula]